MSNILKFEIQWVPGGKHVPRVTTANLAIKVGERTIWPVDGESQIFLEIQADDLLSYLTEFWKPLILRQTFPIFAQLGRPSLLRAEAEKRWESEPDETVQREDALVTAFEDAHDLSRCFAGMFDLPPLWFMRQGDNMLIETKSATLKIPFTDAVSAFVEIGDEISRRLETAAGEPWSELLKAWRTRNLGDPTVILAWSSSLPINVARTFVEEGVLTAPTNVDEAANDNDELRIAARMASALPEEQIREIISLVGGFEKGDSEALRELGQTLRAYMASTSLANKRPFEQGEGAANYIRNYFRLNDADSVEIFKIVRELGVSVHAESVAPSLFALAVWGGKHGPAVLLNEALRHHPGPIEEEWVARVNLAHELCHLLLDHEHTLTAVEVLNSRMPLDIERRAKAFAGEFLLTTRAASDHWKAAGRPRSVEELSSLVQEICREYGVTKNVAAWKLEHGANRENVDLRVPLNSVAPSR